MTFAVGSLVKARGREWVVLPDPRNSDELLIVRPLVGGGDMSGPFGLTQRRHAPLSVVVSP